MTTTPWRHAREGGHPELTQLGSLCQFISGGTPSTKIADYYDGDIPWITSADITDDKITPPRRYITEEAIESSATNLVPPGNLLLVTRTGVGKVAITDTDICISQDFTGIVPDKNRLDVRFLFYYLKFCQDDLVANQRGATIQGITREVVSTLTIPLPPLEEQQRIAEVLARADRLRRLRRAARELSAGYLQAVFLQMFGDPVENPMGWETITLKELCSDPFANGVSLTKEELGEGTKLVNVVDLYEHHTIDVSTLGRVKATERQIKVSRLQKGDIIFVRSSVKREGTAMCAYFPGDNEPVVFGCFNIRFRSDPSKTDPIFLALFLRSEEGRRRLLKKCQTATITNINQAGLGSVSVPLPPLPLQQRFAGVVRRFERLRAQQVEAERQAEALFQSLLARAFASTHQRQGAESQRRKE